MICRCIDLRSFLGTISQGRISSAIGQTMESRFISELSLEHAGYSSAGSSLASLFSLHRLECRLYRWFQQAFPLAVPSLEFVSASAVALDCLSVVLFSSDLFDFRSTLFAIFTAASALPFDCVWYGDDM